MFVCACLCVCCSGPRHSKQRVIVPAQCQRCWINLKDFNKYGNISNESFMQRSRKIEYPVWILAIRVFPPQRSVSICSILHIVKQVWTRINFMCVLVCLRLFYLLVL